MANIRHVHATYDPDAGVWWAESDDLPGLVSATPTLDELVDGMMAVAGELLAANGTAPAGISLQFSVKRQTVRPLLSVTATIEFTYSV